MRGLFVTGTGTGVGKTVVAAGLLRWLRQTRGVDAVPMKPVQTGCVPSPAGGLSAPDLEIGLAAAGLTPAPGEAEWMCPYRYEPACSPHLAGRMAGRYVEIAGVEQAARRLAAAHTMIVAEGAGGAMAPLNEFETMLDLMRRLAWPVAVVAGLGLGTINHTLLTLRALREEGVTVAGVIFNDSLGDAPDGETAFIRADNPPTIEQFSGVPVLGIVGRLAGLNGGADAAAWTQFERALTGLPRLAKALELD